MKKILTYRFAIKGLLIILSCIVFFHLLVISGIIPFKIVWGGRLASRQEMLVFETVSIIVNLLMIAATIIKGNYIKLTIHQVIGKGIFWAMFGLFLMNTLGNLFSKNQFELFVFTPLTFVLALFSWRVAVNKN